MTGRRGRKPHLPVSISSSPAVISLITDFGTSDYFVGAVKGSILSINPFASITDITHEIPPHDVEAGAFTLLAAYNSFPPRTIHFAVVDPGVGSTRRPILVSAGRHFFVGPDNGIFSYIYEREGGYSAFHITDDTHFRHPVSSTFHGRDIFAPVAAALSLGTKPSALGYQIKDEVRLAPLGAVRMKSGKIRGRIIHIDRFGNCVTNIIPEDLAPYEAGAISLRVSGIVIRSFRQFFRDDVRSAERLFFIWGSAGFLEIAAPRKSAAKILRAKRGQSVIVRMKE